MKTRLVTALGLVLALTTWTAATTLGHASLDSSDPAQGDTIKTPYTLTATFDEELTGDGSSIIVQDSTGKTVANGTVSTTDDKVMTVDLPQLPDGGYQVAWTAVTADDHGVTRGVYQFQVSATASGSAAPSTPIPTGASSTSATSTTAPAVTPQPSSSTGSGSGGGNDLTIALVLAVIIIGGVVGYVLYRNRR